MKGFRIRWLPFDKEYVATSLEHPGLSGLGPTPSEALKELNVALAMYKEIQSIESP